MFFYSVTFGGFVGLASSLAIYFNTEYGLDAVRAGLLHGGLRVRGIARAADRRRACGSRGRHQDADDDVCAIAAVMLIIVSFRPQSVYMALILFALCMLAFGMGNGSVFQLVPQRFRHEIGVMTRARGHDWWRRWVLSCVEPWVVQAADRELSDRVAGVCVACGDGAGWAHEHQASVAHDVGCDWVWRTRGFKIEEALNRRAAERPVAARLSGAQSPRGEGRYVRFANASGDCAPSIDESSEQPNSFADAALAGARS